MELLRWNWLTEKGANSKAPNCDVKKLHLIEKDIKFCRNCLACRESINPYLGDVGTMVKPMPVGDKQCNGRDGGLRRLPLLMSRLHSLHEGPYLVFYGSIRVGSGIDHIGLDTQRRHLQTSKLQPVGEPLPGIV